MASVYDYAAKSLNGEEVSLSAYRGQVLLVVNTASKCGFTPQYAGLESLYKDMHGRGFTVLGFPCNQFGKQEPGDAGEIGAFCLKNYGVSFPMFDKVDVNGPNAHPLFAFLKHEQPGLLGSERIKWNFTKFLVNRGGQVVDRFAPLKKPEDLAQPIQALF